MSTGARRAALTGWGRATSSTATLLPAGGPDLVRELVRTAPSRGVLARGLGGAYGDAAMNAGGVVLDMTRAGASVEVDTARACVTADAGVSVRTLLDRLLPLGLMLPVVPGTQQVSLGGALAADVHGKNHHRDSSIGAWVQELTLVDGAGELRTLRPDRDPGPFWATIGGMGLTGVIVSATLRLLRVASPLVRVRSARIGDFDELLRRLAAADAARYQVAWVDCLATGRGRYRAVLDEGEHASADEAAGARSLPRRPALTVPRLPASPLRPGLVRAFNAARFHLAAQEESTLAPLTRYFFPLDAAREWNRLYGPRGLLQYQLVVPLAASGLLRRALDALLRAGAPPYLVVLKRMGAATPAPLSFPLPGWTLAVDVPAAGAQLATALDRLDEEVAAAGGRVYLAKDARLRPAALPAMYPRLAEWRAARAALDPAGRVCSDLARRTGLL